MSNRFHNKFHRHNHHTEPTADPKYPDSGYDPIASPQSPFKGEFYAADQITTTDSFSAGQHIYAVDGNFSRNVTVSQVLSTLGNAYFDSNVEVTGSLTVDGNGQFNQNVGILNDLLIGNDLIVENNANIQKSLVVDENLTVFGNLSVLGDTSQVDTKVFVTSALEITNVGTGPALKVTQTGNQPIAHFIDANGGDVVINDDGFLGIATLAPTERFTLFGNVTGTHTKVAFNNSEAQGTFCFSANVGSASGVNSFAEGSGRAHGIYAHAEGSNTAATGFGSHAEGDNTIASEIYSHAEGKGTIASGQASHAEGTDTVAFGNYSHAEGEETTSSGNASHSEGINTIASGYASHAAGFYSEAAHDRTWVWKGSTSTQHLSTTRANQFMVSAAGGAAFFGNVGINTDTIENALTVVGNLSTQGKLFGEGSSITNAIVTGKTIYVDANTGTDTRGTLSKYSAGSPFATIDAAVAASATLDTIRVRAGSYTISSTINLNLKGNLLFEAGATVNVASNIVAFSYSQNSVPISILGYANFVLAGGTAGVLTMPSGNATTAVQFECNSISGPNSVTGTLFNCAVGALSVDAKLIQMTTNFAASNATVFNITGTGVVTARIPFVYCGVFLNGAGAANPGGDAPARFNSDVWTLATFNATAGMNLNLITTNFRIVNYNHAGGVVFNWTEDTVDEGHLFNGVRWFSGLGLPNMSFASSAGTTTKKIISLKESNVFKGSLTNSLSSAVPINVWVNNSYADVAASANVTFKVGSFTVDPLVGNM